MIKLDEKDLYQLLIAEFRYAFKRDNHLAPSGCAQHIKDYLPEMKQEWRAQTAKQLTEEIIQEHIWSHGTKPRLEHDSDWERLQVFLLKYLDQLPYNADKYMQYLFEKPTWDAHIDYFSVAIRDQLLENKLKN